MVDARRSLLITAALGVLCLGVVTVLPASGAKDSRKESLQSLAQAERDFSNAVRYTGMREAFLHFADDQALLFRPGAVSAREWLTQQPTTPGILVWTPTYADVSLGGDLGWTTGPWEFMASKQERPRAFGQYVNVWRRQSDGTWRYLVEIGTGNPLPVIGVDSLVYSADPASGGKAAVPKRLGAKDCEESLLSFERALSDSVRERGARAVLEPLLAPDARMIRKDHQQRVGRATVAASLPGPRDTLSWVPERAVVAKQCDLAFTYGRYVLRPSAVSTLRIEDGNYFRIWRRTGPEGRWNLVVDLLLPTSRV